MYSWPTYKKTCNCEVGLLFKQNVCAKNNILNTVVALCVTPTTQFYMSDFFKKKLSRLDTLLPNTN